MLISDIALMLTAVGVLAAVYSLRQSRRLRLREFEDTFVHRYWSIMDRLTLDALRGTKHGGVSDEDERAARAFFLLCEDEIELRKNGWISDATWNLWRDGIRQQMDGWPFAEVWKLACTEHSAVARFACLHELMNDEPDHDPCRMRSFQRWRHGLTGGPGV